MADRPGSIISATIWMFVLSILLFWLPVVGPLIAGFIGGKKAGSLGNAVLAALMPGLVVGIIIFFAASLLAGMPLLGFVAGAGGFALMAAHVFPLLIGAALGAIL